MQGCYNLQFVKAQYLQSAKLWSAIKRSMAGLKSDAGSGTQRLGNPGILSEKKSPLSNSWSDPHSTWWADLWPRSWKLLTSLVYVTLGIPARSDAQLIPNKRNCRLRFSDSECKRLRKETVWWFTYWRLSSLCYILGIFVNTTALTDVYIGSVLAERKHNVLWIKLGCIIFFNQNSSPFALYMELGWFCALEIWALLSLKQSNSKDGPQCPHLGHSEIRLSKNYTCDCAFVNFMGLFFLNLAVKVAIQPTRRSPGKRDACA